MCIEVDDQGPIQLHAPQNILWPKISENQL